MLASKFLDQHDNWRKKTKKKPPKKTGQHGYQDRALGN